MTGAIILIMGLILLVVIVLCACIRVVPQSYAYVVETLGTYKETWGSGLHMMTPFLDTVAKRVSLKEQIADFPPQPVITKDNVTMQIDSVVFYRIVEPKLYTYGVERPISAIESLTATTLRNIIGELELDETLTSRDTINSKMRTILDEATDPWGIKVTRVELKNIMPPRDIQESMEKQMRAERERREKILQAEGEKKSAILLAEGEKASAILKAEAQKEVAILHADAEREKLIREADGKAQAILRVNEAEAKALEMLNNAKPNKETISLKSLDTLAKVADGKATKVIIPSEIQNITGLIEGIRQTKD